MECAPTASADTEVVNAALPETNVAVPSMLAPFLKVTVPVGVAVVADLTVAAKVTAVP